jgi:hypothetical protein
MRFLRRFAATLLPALAIGAIAPAAPEPPAPRAWAELRGGDCPRPCELPMLLTMAFVDFQYPGIRVVSFWRVLGCRV